jgi:hypothetical protein
MSVQPKIRLDKEALARIKSLVIPPVWTTYRLPNSNQAFAGDRARRTGPQTEL